MIKQHSPVFKPSNKVKLLRKFLQEISKLNDSVMNKNYREQAQISPEKKIIEKGKWV